MIRRVLLVAAAVLAVAVLARPDEDRPLAVVGHAETTTTATSTTKAPTTSTTAPGRTVVSTRSTTVVRSDGGSVTVVNEGSASASTGDNTVIGPPSATVNEGAVTAVGNSAEVRIRP